MSRCPDCGQADPCPDQLAGYEALLDLRESALRIWTALHAADQARGLYGSMPEMWFAYLPIKGEWAPAEA